jgi:hypothetical protein
MWLLLIVVMMVRFCFVVVVGDLQKIGRLP